MWSFLGIPPKWLIFLRSIGGSNPCFRRERANKRASWGSEYGSVVASAANREDAQKRSACPVRVQLEAATERQLILKIGEL
jgi:hypothetical protein